MKENWEIIINYPDYMISDHGRVKSFKYNKERILKSNINGEGYYVVRLSRNGKVKTIKISRLIGLHFIQNNNKQKNCINHINGKKYDDRLENLEWEDVKGNTQHAYDTGLTSPSCGEDHCRSKLTEKQVLEIREFYSTGDYTYKEISYLYNVTWYCIKDIIKRINWKHI